MKLLISVSVALASTVPASAEHRYDRKLEQAAMRIVAEKIGEIRGGFSYGQKPRFVVVQDALLPDPGPPEQQVSPSSIAPPAPPAS